MQSDVSRVIHNIRPVYDRNSKVLILGSFPSVKSRAQQFFYGHPRNRFWKVIAAVTGQDEPVTINDKKTMLISGGIAVWDVIASCSIHGSSDSSIRDVVPNDIGCILHTAEICGIFCNGSRAFELYNKYLKDTAGMEAVKLPSTSPANAAWSLERLIEVWKDTIGPLLETDS